MDTMYASSIIFILVLSAWKCLSNSILVASYIKKKSKTFTKFSLNIVCLTINALFQGVCGIMIAVVGFVAETYTVGTRTCSIPLILFIFSITYDSWQTLYVFIQRFMAFSSRRISPNSRQIVLVSVGLLFVALFCVGLPLQEWTKDKPGQRLKMCSSNVFVNPTITRGYIAFLAGLPGIISVVLFIGLHVYFYRRTRVVPVDPTTELATRSTNLEEINIPPNTATSNNNTGESVICKSESSPSQSRQTSSALVVEPIPSTVNKRKFRPAHLIHVKPDDSASHETETSENTETFKEHKNERLRNPKRVLSTKWTRSVQTRCMAVMRLGQTSIAVQQNQSGLRSLNGERKALKTLAFFLLLNTSLPIQYLIIWLVYYRWPLLPGIRYVHTLSFLLLYFNTSLNVFVIVKRYRVIREAVLDVTRGWKEAIKKMSLL